MIFLIYQKIKRNCMTVFGALSIVDENGEE